MPKKSSQIQNSIPVLTFLHSEINNFLGTAYINAVHNLIDINTVPDTEQEYNNTGLLSNPSAKIIMAGVVYKKPWTRDASINCWNAASLLEPDVARNTLWAVCERNEFGKLVTQRDNQWWDKVIWITGAWSHYKITGDTDFLKDSYEVSRNNLKEMETKRYNEVFGLFKGPAALADGISGYPAPLYDSRNGAEFVLDHKGTDEIMVLSTNCIYYNAYKCAELMASQLGRPDKEISHFNCLAEKLRERINQHFWIPAKGLYGYFIYGEGLLEGTLDESEEGIGLSYTVIFNVADADRIKQVLQNTHVQPKGITCVWPHFDRYSDEQPGRHNVMNWPIASGLWAHAAAIGGKIDLFKNEVDNLVSMVNASDNIFFDIYNSISGNVDGGWQICDGIEHHYGSCINQTWSATAYLRMIFYGLFGMKFERDKLNFSPMLPLEWGPVTLNGVNYREMTLNISIKGSGNKVKRFLLDGVAVLKTFVSSELTGTHAIIIEME
ncbi:MAG: hypothetical protein K8S00_06185 [Bacteroidales bacterium]|nr:hypothetical protein [Bacteroidales bacterium]